MVTTYIMETTEPNKKDEKKKKEKKRRKMNQKLCHQMRKAHCSQSFHAENKTVHMCAIH